MKLFREYYLKLIFLIIYFWLLLPYGLSQANDAIVIVSMVSFFIVIYFIINECVKLFRRLE